MEEYDLSYRLIDAGYSIGYDPAVTIEHGITDRAGSSITPSCDASG